VTSDFKLVADHLLLFQSAKACPPHNLANIGEGVLISNAEGARILLGSTVPVRLGPPRVLRPAPRRTDSLWEHARSRALVPASRQTLSPSSSAPALDVERWTFGGSVIRRYLFPLRQGTARAMPCA